VGGPRKEARRRVEASYAARGVLGARRGRRGFAKHPPRLEAEGQRVLEDLRRYGLAVTSFDTLVGDAELWHRLAADMDEFAERIEAEGAAADAPQEKTDYLVWRNRSAAGGNTFSLPADDPWIRYAVDTPIHDVVNAYRERWTKLSNVDQWYTRPFSGQTLRVASQRWHRDPEDRHVVKVFTYFSHVDEGAGPFEYLTETKPGSRYGDAYPWKPFGKKYRTPEELAEKVPADQHKRLTGSPGTVILAETSGFHRGGFAKDKPRLLSVQTYISAAALESGLARRWYSIDGEPVNGHEAPARYALT